MADLSQYAGSDGDSKWLKAKDWPSGTRAVLKVSAYEIVDFSTDEKPQKPKVGINFDNKEAGIILNQQNTGRLMEAFGSEGDSWIGKSVVVESEKISNGTYAGSFMFRVSAESAESDDIPF
jgi:hypothetical protein